jgi:hypothetical protein
MSDLSDAATEIRAAFEELYAGVFVTGSPLLKNQILAISNALGPILDNPTPDAVTQPRANDIGLVLRNLSVELRAYNLGHLVELEEKLHQLCSQALVDFYPDIDWYEAAGSTRPAKGEMQTQAGVKHEPAPTARAA